MSGGEVLKANNVRSILCLTTRLPLLYGGHERDFLEISKRIRMCIDVEKQDIVRQSLFIVCTRWFSTGHILFFSNTKPLANSHPVESFSFIRELL
jgi:hypothetical protein